ncbi:MAG: DNA-binding protein WhiA [Lachnospiraceae bacterium]|nr:DNA-binding protein WhiA [Lachnospiraceae bacterium]
MSFSGQVKEELSQVTPGARHCQLAELAAIFEFCGYIRVAEGGRPVIGIVTDSKTISIKCFTLLKKTFNIYTGVSVRKSGRQSKNMTYELCVEDTRKVKEILMAFKLWDDVNGMCADMSSGVNALLLKKDCCRRAYLRGVYLTIGSMSNPEKGYHLEFVCDKEEQSGHLIGVLAEFGIEAKEVIRKRYHVVYIKDGEAIVDMLNIMGAHVALMELENTRIYKEIRNSINRRVNCEAANINKTVSAATKQVEDILYIKEHMGLDKLPVTLKEMALVRLENPDTALKELGELLDPPVGKSGVNHRLRKLSELADRLRVN